MIEVIRETLGRILYILPSIPKQAQIEVTNICNLRCKMCPREDLDLDMEHIPYDRFKEIVDRLNGVRNLTLTGWGEPFLHPNIFEMIRYSKDKGFEVQITTNGVFKNDSIISEINESGLDSISFSMDSVSNGHQWGHQDDKIAERIKKLISSRKGKSPCVTLQATVHKNGGRQIEDVIHFCAEAGGDRVNLGRLYTRLAPEMERPNLEEERRIFKKADEIGVKLGVQVDCIQYGISKGMERTLYRLLKNTLHRMGKYCLKTYSYVYINNKGDVTPCCILPNYSTGNILESELASIWKSAKFENFRKNQKKICGKCDLWEIKHLA